MNDEKLTVLLEGARATKPIRRILSIFTPFMGIVTWHNTPMFCFGYTETGQKPVYEVNSFSGLVSTWRSLILLENLPQIEQWSLGNCLMVTLPLETDKDIQNDLFSLRSLFLKKFHFNLLRNSVLKSDPPVEDFHTIIKNAYASEVTIPLQDIADYVMRGKLQPSPEIRALCLRAGETETWNLIRPPRRRKTERTFIDCRS